eukprot:CAMPEP_0170076114 /NCGR_PEP_ID=MMETSP0019_2-20121128/13143_1 /TAXON_ID=98059 /ORGANISM="Dinobryon sp., Strain UTEXLB2267" /LENGTH=576 /DNA_ID=CAMNT_0010287543 /DNA_START=221 /DNA_END=1952 /DNA_ORIENTATION=-
MTNREKKKYLLTVELFSTQILTPQIDFDVETAKLIWRMRTAMRAEYPWAVTLFVLSVDWLNAEESEEAYKLLYNWKRPSPADVLQLLDYRFQDARVRAYAVTMLSFISGKYIVPIGFSPSVQPYSDSSLVRFLLRRAVGNPILIGRKLCLHLLNTYTQNPTANSSYCFLLNLLMRSLPDIERARISHGWYLFRKLDESFREKHEEFLVAQAAVAEELAASSSLFSRRKHPSEKLKQPRNAVDALIDTMLATSVPTEFYTPLSNRLCVAIEKYVALPDEGRKKSFAVSLTVDKAVSKADKLRVVYSQDMDSRVEMLFSQMMKTLEFIWEQESIGIIASVYDSCILDSKMDALMFEQPLDAVTLNSIIVKALFPVSNKSAIAQPQPNAAKKIPDNLLVDYFSSKQADESDVAASREAFKFSLSAFLVSVYVLSIFGVSATNTLLTTEGKIFLKSPECILGCESSLNGTKKRKMKRSKEPLFYLPCFAKVFGVDDSVHHSEFHHILSTAFLSVRKHSPFLVASFVNISSSLQFPEEDQKQGLSMLKDALLNNMDDATALLKFMECVNRGLHLDYQINVS